MSCDDPVRNKVWIAIALLGFLDTLFLLSYPNIMNLDQNLSFSKNWYNHFWRILQIRRILSY